MTKIKICGIRRSEDVTYINETLPDYAGFIFDSTRKRYISPEVAAELKKQMDQRIRTVGVFVNAEPDLIISLAKSGVIDLVQLHGQETKEMIEELRKSLEGVEIIKAVALKKAEDIAESDKFNSDYILPDVGAGGTGETFDWSLLQTGMKHPIFLAGGLHAGNVAEAIARTKPYAVDVSSGVETDGVKDLDKIRAFVNAVRSCDADAI